VPEFCAVPIPPIYFAQTISVIMEQLFALSTQIRILPRVGVTVDGAWVG
jgi:hypothetical protein